MDSNISTTCAWFSQRNPLLECHDVQETALPIYIHTLYNGYVWTPTTIYRCLLNRFNIGNHPITSLFSTDGNMNLMYIFHPWIEYQSLLTSLICHTVIAGKGLLEGGIPVIRIHDSITMTSGSRADFFVMLEPCFCCSLL